MRKTILPLPTGEGRGEGEGTARPSSLAPCEGQVHGEEVVVLRVTVHWQGDGRYVAFAEDSASRRRLLLATGRAHKGP